MKLWQIRTKYLQIHRIIVIDVRNEQQNDWQMLHNKYPKFDVSIKSKIPPPQKKTKNQTYWYFF